MIIFRILKILLGMLMLANAVFSPVVLPVDGFLAFLCLFSGAMGFVCIMASGERWTSFKWVDRMEQRAHARRCSKGNHEWKLEERHPVSWCVGHVYAVCKHCPAEEFRGKKINWD